MNVNGLPITLGGTIARTGIRVLVTLMHEMRRRIACYGLGHLERGCRGIASIFERN